MDENKKSLENSQSKEEKEILKYSTSSDRNKDTSTSPKHESNASKSHGFSEALMGVF